MAKVPFILAETEDVTAISAPLKSTQRIKYTCFDVSENFLVFGATSGGLYVFRRNPCTFLQLLPNKDGAIAQVAISPNEKFFAFASVKGVVCVLELNEGPGARRLLVSMEHHDHEVSALLWNTRSDELFAGDDEGSVSVVTVSLFLVKPMFPVPPFQLMQLDSRIVQMDWFADLLLISTLTRCYLCDTIKEQYRQIGHKLREGEFGACFFVPADGIVPCRPEPRSGMLNRSSFTSVGEEEESRGCEGLQDVRLFCARPGSRLWEVDVQGTVLRTHQFKDALAIPPAHIVNLLESCCPDAQSSTSSIESQSSSWNPQSFNFPRLFTILKNFLMTFSERGVYIFNPEESSVILWSDEIKDIVDGKVVRDTMYLCTTSGDVRALTVSSIENFLVKLYFQKEYSLCAHLCFVHKEYLLSQVTVSPKLCILSDIARKIENSEITDKISSLLEEISKLYDNKRSSVKLESGIVIIGNQHYLAKEDEKQLRSRLASFIKKNATKEKSRSLNTSPKLMRRQRSAINVASKHNRSGSTSSLPEILQNSNSGSSRTLTDYEHNVLTSPEARQVLKELGQSVSGKLVIGTKSLKEKWHKLENKMKFMTSSASEELIGIRPQNYADDDDDDDDFDIEDKNAEDVVQKKCVHQYPALNVTPLLEVSQEIQKSDVENILQNGAKFFLALKLLFDEFGEAVNSTEKARTSDNVTDSSVLQDASKSSQLKLVNFTPKDFPFQHYFQGDILQLVFDTLHGLFRFQLVIDFLQTMEGEDLSLVPDQLLSFHKPSELELDAKMCKFLNFCSNIVDPNIMLQNIKVLKLPCYYKTLVVLLDVYQKGKRQLQVNAVDDEKSLIMQLNVILMMLRMGQVETCSKMGNALDLKDILYLILRVQEMSIESGVDLTRAKVDSHRMFLSFLDKSPHCSERVSSALHDAELSTFLIAAYEELNIDLAYSCRCGYPAPRPPEPQFLTIGCLILGHLMRVSGLSFEKFLHRVPGMWRSYLDMKADSCSMSDLPLIIHLGNIALLEEVLSRASPELWVDVFDMFAKFRSGLCLNCKKRATWTKRGEGISWSMLGLQAVKWLGPSSALQHISHYTNVIGSGELDARLFQSFIFSAIVDKHASGLRDRVVDMLVDTSEKKTKKALMSQEVGKALTEALWQDGVMLPALPAPKQGDHHWGVGVDLQAGRCPICWLPLGSLVLLRDGELVVFRCGHAYHSVCLRQRGLLLPACLLCDKTSTPSTVAE